MISLSPRVKWIAVGLGAVVITITLATLPFPPATDWDTVFRPATLALLRGEDPYQYIYNPPWLLFPLIPFAVLPYNVGRALMLVAGLSAFALAAWKMGATPAGVIVFSTAPLVFNSLGWGNVEWLAALGLVVAPPLGVLLLAVKPQMTVAVILFLFVEAWRQPDRHAVVSMAAASITAAALSLVLFGWWPLRALAYLEHRETVMNLSFMPYSLPLGLALVVAAVRTRRMGYAVAASPCFFSVLTPQVWLVALLAVAGSAPELIAASLGLWMIVILTRLG